MLKVGVVGFSQQDFCRPEAERILWQTFMDFKDQYGTDVEVVSGYTDLGIPGLAYDLAEEFGFRTVGIACRKAYNYICYPVDHRIIVGDNWGDESETFLNYCDEFIRVGGGQQSLAEVAQSKQLGKRVQEFELEIEVL